MTNKNHLVLFVVALVLISCEAAISSPTALPEPTVAPSPAPTFLEPTVMPSLAPVSEAPSATPTLKPPTPTTESTDKILFVGNSFTFWNNSLEYHMEQLAGSADIPLVIEADAVVMAGAPLKQMWEYTRTREKIGEGAYDVVVLQEDIPETLVDTFHEYARKFDAEIKEAGAEPVLFMAWSYERLNWITMEEIAQAHRDIATELGIEVAPVGLAWQRAMEERPDLDMYDLDREHPSIYGTYLAVNVVYATVFGESPIGLAYLPSESGGVTEEEAAFLQRIAWETVQEYQAQ